MANNTAELKKFAQAARRQLREQVASRLEQVLGTDSAELRQQADAIHELRQQIVETSKKAVIDRVAYTWFNRFCALRFMDVNRYNRIGVVSPAEGFTLPEILQEAKQGYIDDDLANLVNRPVVFDLLSGKAPSRDPQQESYRLLLVGMCNALSKTMPFMFETINDYTELLMPPDLLSDYSILNELRKVMTPEACQDVEIIGWLYQYYISERKDEVFEALKQNQKIEAEDIPAATQLFTPHWIVRYLVENSLGRLWMLNHPNSKLIEQMEYYIRPVEEETDFLRINFPEEIKVCDPACGSGHMLTYAFDLLYAIYEEEGYPAVEIPRLILEKNLYGIEIDERAGTLAAFALVMKARGRDRRSINREMQPNICVLDNIRFTDQELKEYADAMGRDLFTEPLLQTLKQFEQAKNFGSLIRPAMTDVAFVRSELEHKGMGGNIFLFGVHERVLQILKSADYLGSQYHLVVTNPPYMGGAGMNDGLRNYINTDFLSGSTDLYGCFIERCLEFIHENCYIGMVTFPNWMFLETFIELRDHLIENIHISSLIHNGRGVFGSDFGSCSFVLLKNSDKKDQCGLYKRLFNKQGEVITNEVLIQRFFDCNAYPWIKSTQERFLLIPGHPIAYWVTSNFIDTFKAGRPLGDIMPIKSGMATTDNNRFLRFWSEVSYSRIGLNISNLFEAKESEKKWFPYKKGGEFRRWYGNDDLVLNWYNDGQEIKEAVTNNPKDPKTTHWSRRIFGVDYFFIPGITWTSVSISRFSCRYHLKGHIFSNASNGAFPEKDHLFYLAFLNSKVADEYLNILSPTVNYKAGDLSKIPVLGISEETKDKVQRIAERLLDISSQDWDSSELSWNFKKLPLLRDRMNESEVLENEYLTLRAKWKETVLEMQVLEEENNCIFIDTYKLKNEVSPLVSLPELTVNWNSYHRYNSHRSEAELEALLLADTMREFISYAVGCMLGRYSLDKPGLILANQGETIQDYLKQLAKPTFQPDEDNVIPILDGEWFSDDITERFKKFLRVTFGDEHYEENLAFIEEAIGHDIRSYFVRDFYAYHLKMYQKRPIYWLFSSPKGSFNVLIYMHRYNRDTISVILNKYLRPFQSKLEARKSYLEQLSISGSASPREKTAALKEIEKLTGTLEELRVYERDILYPLAAQRIEIDLDDGVKVNYAKFGKALAKIPGLTS